ncbi:MAG: hypothetical protein ABII06_00795, partial [Pseudomonadota bacterium]
HIEKTINDKGEKILKASEKACTACHKGRENLLKDWKTDLDRGLKETLNIEKEALDALSKAESRLSEAKLGEARKMLKEGRETFNMVRYGNGVHNKKYAMLLLNAAMIRFEELLDYIEKGQ